MYVDSNKLAEALGVTAQTVRNWRKRDPEFPHWNIGTEDHPIYRYVIEEVVAHKRKGVK